MTKHAFDKKLEALQALRSASDSTSSCEQLRTALKDRNNYLVARAAAIVAELKLEELIPDLLAAFDRFFMDPVKSDAKCLAKNAIARALKDLGHRGAPAYVRGMGHFQFEPAWGGSADSAGTLRGTCALALTNCLMDDIEILTYLADGLADPETSVRIDCAMAIDQLGRTEGVPLLRLKLLSGDREPDVLGQCFASLLSLAPQDSVAFISRFLNSADQGIQLEAASALAQCRERRAIEILEEFWQEPRLSLDVRRAVLISLGASPLPDAVEFLLSIISGESTELAVSAITALATSRFRLEMRARVAAVVQQRDRPELSSIFEQKFGPSAVPNRASNGGPDSIPDMR
ncbi:MAG: HEAT repeat domain-containing protein [Chloroflexota bacterium]|nr:HEAT repeat domain-containing protein [Chloroflexota bacterium]